MVVAFVAGYAGADRVDWHDDFDGGGTVAAHSAGDRVIDHPNWQAGRKDGGERNGGPGNWNMSVGTGDGDFTGNYADGFDKDSRLNWQGDGRVLIANFNNGITNNGLDPNRDYTLTFVFKTEKNGPNTTSAASVGAADPNNDGAGADGLWEDRRDTIPQTTHNTEFGFDTTLRQIAGAAPKGPHIGWFQGSPPEDQPVPRNDFRLPEDAIETNMGDLIQSGVIHTGEIILDGSNNTVSMAIYEGRNSTRNGGTAEASFGPVGGHSPADYNRLLLLYDFGMWDDGFGTFGAGNRSSIRLDDILLTSTPEPVSLVALALTGMVVLRREKRA
ncbi:MAG: hypothetical protein CMJ18_05335 [Phycisphaeraceae bacterium]|nr:hypothetical protein [Phycisphaeraceae bacterium]